MELQELLLKQKRYLKFPDDLNKISNYNPDIEKLSFHNCSNCNLLLDGEHWPNLRYIEMIGCKYFSFSLYFPSSAKFEQIFISNSEYFDILDIIGEFPSWRRWLFKNSKYIKFKGDLLGNIQLELLEFHKCLQSTLFLGKTVLPNLVSIQFLDHSHFCSIDFRSLKAERLQQLWFADSNYLNIISLGDIAKNLRSFKFENCSYPKLNVDFSKLNQAAKLKEKKDIDSYIQDIKRSLPFPFRKVSNPLNNKEIDQNHLKMQTQKELQEELEEISLNRDLNTKYCPECGTKNLLSAQFCRGCGNPFPF
ncbi:zinc ribbon domain-containing protein [Candidatus Harpocratesius sp.]